MKEEKKLEHILCLIQSVASVPVIDYRLDWPGTYAVTHLLVVLSGEGRVDGVVLFPGGHLGQVVL